MCRLCFVGSVGNLPNLYPTSPGYTAEIVDEQSTMSRFLLAEGTLHIASACVVTCFHETDSTAVFHNLCLDYHEITAPPLDCARSGYLHTICSVVTGGRDFITTTQTAVSTILGHVFTQTRLTALPSHQQHLQPTCVCRFHACKLHQFHQRLQVSCFCKSHQFHQDSTQ